LAALSICLADSLSRLPAVAPTTKSSSRCFADEAGPLVSLGMDLRIEMVSLASALTNTIKLFLCAGKWEENPQSPTYSVLSSKKVHI